MAALLMSCENVKVVRSGRTILDAPALDIEKGEILVVLGTTGAGKTTLLNVLDLSVRPDAGNVKWNGEDIKGANLGSAIRRKVSMAFQTPLLFRGTVFDNVAYGLKIRGYARPEIDKKVESTLRMFGIENLSGANAASLSGGEAHRASLARAIVFEPELLLLDEPMASLDPGTKEHLLKEVAAILKRLGITCVYVTHSREEAYGVADRLAVIEDGRIAQTGTVDEIFYKPATPDLAIFIGTENVLKGKVIEQNGGLAVIDISGAKVEALTEAPVGENVTVCIRPEEVFVKMSTTGSAASNDSARNRLAGRVEQVDVLGATAKITIDCGFPLKALITRRSMEEMDIGPGVMVIAGFKATSAHVIRKSADEA
jgi:tungstate transport system ATP-binding protein